MNTRRSYRQFCGLARALDVVGERWSLLLVRNLLLGPRRYGELLNGLPGITTNLLAKRLRELTALGVIEKEGGGYALTGRGKALEPAVAALGAWGSDLLRESEAAGYARSLSWLLVSLKRRYRGGTTLRVNLVTPAESFRMALSPTAITVERGGAPDPDLVLEGAEDAIMAALSRGALDSLTVVGNPAHFRSLQAALGLPLFP